MWITHGDFKHTFTAFESPVVRRQVTFENTATTAVIKKATLMGSDGGTHAQIFASNPAAYQSLKEVAAAAGYQTDGFLEHGLKVVRYSSKNKLLMARFLKTIQNVEADFALIEPTLSDALGINLAEDLVLPAWIAPEEIQALTPVPGNTSGRKIVFANTESTPILNFLSFCDVQGSLMVTAQAGSDAAYQQLVQLMTSAGFPAPYAYESSNNFLSCTLNHPAMIARYIKMLTVLDPGILAITPAIADALAVDLSIDHEMPAWIVTGDSQKTPDSEYTQAWGVSYENTNPLSIIRDLTLITHPNHDKQIIIRARNDPAYQNLLRTIMESGFPEPEYEVDHTLVFINSNLGLIANYIKVVQTVEPDFSAIVAAVSKALNIDLVKNHPMPTWIKTGDFKQLRDTEAGQIRQVTYENPDAASTIKKLFLLGHADGTIKIRAEASGNAAYWRLVGALIDTGFPTPDLTDRTIECVEFPGLTKREELNTVLATIQMVCDIKSIRLSIHLDLGQVLKPAAASSSDCRHLQFFQEQSDSEEPGFLAASSDHEFTPPEGTALS